MRGSPAIRLLIIIIAMGLMIIPLRYVTSKTVPTAPQENATQKAAESAVQLTISATAALDFEILHLGKTVWKGEAAAAKQKTDLKMPFPAEGIELVVSGEVKGETFPVAIRLSVAAGNNAPIEKTVWAETKTVDDVLLFKP